MYAHDTLKDAFFRLKLSKSKQRRQFFIMSVYEQTPFVNDIFYNQHMERQVLVQVDNDLKSQMHILDPLLSSNHMILPIWNNGNEIYFSFTSQINAQSFMDHITHSLVLPRYKPRYSVSLRNSYGRGVISRSARLEAAMLIHHKIRWRSDKRCWSLIKMGRSLYVFDQYRYKSHIDAIASNVTLKEALILCSRLKRNHLNK